MCEGENKFIDLTSFSRSHSPLWPWRNRIFGQALSIPACKSLLKILPASAPGSTCCLLTLGCQKLLTWFCRVRKAGHIYTIGSIKWSEVLLKNKVPWRQGLPRQQPCLALGHSVQSTRTRDVSVSSRDWRVNKAPTPNTEAYGSQRISWDCVCVVQPVMRSSADLTQVTGSSPAHTSGCGLRGYEPEQPTRSHQVFSPQNRAGWSMNAVFKMRKQGPKGWRDWLPMPVTWFHKTLVTSTLLWIRVSFGFHSEFLKSNLPFSESAFEISCFADWENWLVKTFRWGGLRASLPSVIQVQNRGCNHRAHHSDYSVRSNLRWQILSSYFWSWNACKHIKAFAPALIIQNYLMSSMCKHVLLHRDHLQIIRCDLHSRVQHSHTAKGPVNYTILFSLDFLGLKKGKHSLQEGSEKKTSRTFCFSVR